MKNIYNFINEIKTSDNTNTADTFFKNISKIIEDEDRIINKSKAQNTYINEYNKFVSAIFAAFYIYYKNKDLKVLRNCDTSELFDFYYINYSRNFGGYGWFTDVMLMKNADEFDRRLKERLNLTQYIHLVYFDSENYIKIDLKENKIYFNIYNNKEVIDF